MCPKSVLLTLLLLPALSVPCASQTAPSKQDQITQHARMAQQYLKEKRPELAIPEFQALVALDPGNADAHGNLGVLLFFRRDFKAAAPELRTAIKLQPELWKIRALLGLAEANLGDTNASREDLETAFPHLTEAKIQNEVGQVLINGYTLSGDLEKAATVVSTMLALQPTDTTMLYTAYRLYSDLAGKAMLTLALVAPGSAQMHQVMARELGRHGDEAAAVANYREAIKIDPRLAGLHSELGDLLYHSSDAPLKAESESEFRAALAVSPRDAKAHMMLGAIAEKQGDVKAAYDDYSHAMEIDPNDGDAVTAVGKTLISMNQPEKAQQMFERAIQIDPTNYLAHYRLGTLYRQAGKTEEAKQQVAEYLKYKQMKEKLEKIFHDMRVLSGHNVDEDQEGK
jgi:Tfp pilus assembly protein PilF